MLQELNRLKHQDIIKNLTNPNLDPWVKVYYSNKCTDALGELLYAVMIPMKWVSTILQHSGWDISLHSLIPNNYGCFMDYEGDIEYTEDIPVKNLETFRLPLSDTKLIVIKRNYNETRPDHIEISQDIIHYFNLFYEKNTNEFIYFDQDGGESIVIKITDNSVEIRRDILNQYIFRKKLALVFYIDSYRYSESSLEALSTSEIRERLQADTYQYKRSVLSGNKLALYESCGWICGKKVVFPVATIEKREEKYQEFIIDTNLDGTEIRKSCYPYCDDVTYLTRVFFKRSVLEKYIHQPEKYTIADGYIEHIGHWHFRIDNHSSEYIVAYLGDLGMDLPENERYHWLSHNIAPHGKTGSQIEYKRSFMCEATDSDSLDFVFKRKYECFNEKHKVCHGWYFFKKFHKDEHCFKCLSICDETIDSFLNQINNLDKILAESICVKKINDHITHVDDEKSIEKLGRYLKSQNISNYEIHIKNLKLIKKLRNQNPHLKGKEFEKLKKQYNLNIGNYRQAFLTMLKKSIEFIDFLETNLIHQEVNV